MQLYTGLRTKYCTLIGRAICLSISIISIDLLLSAIRYQDADGGVTTIFDMDRFAQEDGFADWNDMRAFWSNTHPGADHFNGTMIRWTGFKAATDA